MSRAIRRILILAVAAGALVTFTAATSSEPVPVPDESGPCRVPPPGDFPGAPPPWIVPGDATETVAVDAGGRKTCTIRRADGSVFGRAFTDEEGRPTRIEYFTEESRIFYDVDITYPASESARSLLTHGQPGPNPDRCSTSPPQTAAPQSVAALFALAALAAVAVACRPSGESGCAPLLVFDGTTYHPISVPAGQKGFPPGAELGAGVIPGGCVDDAGAQPLTEDVQVTVVRLEGVSPAVAVGARGEISGVFSVHGRCHGFRGWDAVWRCLHESLRFQGRSYTAIRVEGDPAVAPLPLGGSLGEGELVYSAGPERTSVALAEIEGIDPSVAVAPAGDPLTLYVADGVCNEFAVAKQLLDCLREQS